MNFKVGDIIHAKPKYSWLKQDVLCVKKLDSKRDYTLQNIITNQIWYLNSKDTNYFFEKTHCHIPARHPLTNIFQ